MRRITSLLIGLFTAVLFLGVGTTLLMEQKHVFGGIVIALGLFRLVVLIRQYMAMKHNDRLDAEEAAEAEGEGPPKLR